MNRISSITICNNEGMLFDTDHSYLIKLRPRVSGIEYDPLKTPAQVQSTIYAKGFGVIILTLMELLTGSLGCKANHRKTFYNPADFTAWRRDVEFSDADVAWYVQIEYLDGTRTVCVCTNHEPAPAELDYLEKLVKESLEMA